MDEGEVDRALHGDDRDHVDRRLRSTRRNGSIRSVCSGGAVDFTRGRWRLLPFVAAGAALLAIQPRLVIGHDADGDLHRFFGPANG
jgi:hypothetical protein